MNLARRIPRKNYASVAAALITVSGLTMTTGLGGVFGYQTLQSPGSDPAVVRTPSPARWEEGPLKELPHYDPKSPEGFTVDLRSRDLSSANLKGRESDLAHADFDSRTRWPKDLPAGFDPAAIMTTARNPGLNVRELHRRGITGKGVGIAIIDQPLLVDHVEYRDRLKMYEEIHIPEIENTASMHGPAVASIAVGRTTGVAPQADLYYIAEQHGDLAITGDFRWDFTWLAKSIDRVLEVNRGLPEGSKIRVISVSVGWSPEQKGYAEVNQAVERARKAGIFVISTSLEETHRLAFHGLGREASKDPDLASSYGPGSWWAEAFLNGERRFSPGTRLLAPMDSRTTASPTGKDEYVYYADGGWSWTVPYLAGLYALACQVRPDITPEEFWAESLRTGKVVEVKHQDTSLLLGNIAQPVALMDALQKKVRTSSTRSPSVGIR